METEEYPTPADLLHESLDVASYKTYSMIKFTANEPSSASRYQSVDPTTDPGPQLEFQLPVK